MNCCVSEVDESGSSLADHLLDVDMGGAGATAPAMPTAAAELECSASEMEERGLRMRSS